MRFEQWIAGYSDEITVSPGQVISFMVSGSPDLKQYDAHIVRLIHGDSNPQGPGLKEETVVADVNGIYPLTEQRSQYGSYVQLNARSLLTDDDSFTLFAFVNPTLVTEHVQPICTVWDGTESGIALVLDERLRPTMWLSKDGVQSCAVGAGSLTVGVWYACTASFDATKRDMQVSAIPVVNPYNSRYGLIADITSIVGKNHGAGEWQWPKYANLLLGAWDQRSDRTEPLRGTFNGKIAMPCIYRRAFTTNDCDANAKSGSQPAVTEGLVGWWDLTQHIDSDRVVSGFANGDDGLCVNLPTRGVTAHNWDGRVDSFREDVTQYGAVHLHEDDVDDLGWKVSCRWEVPKDLPSAVYALRLRSGGTEDRVPFIVRPATYGSHDVLFVAPTASYMAYANEHLATGAAVAQGVAGHTPVLQPLDVMLMDHPEFGLSCYDLHRDGSGVCYSSRHRPVLNMRPGHRFSYLGTWQLPADLYIVDWLNALSIECDIVTDEDLHREGSKILAPYKVVLTGTHPEYVSESIYNAVEEYVAHGGHLMYMGANGYYWVISYHPDKPYCLEVRRGEAGSRAWQARPGELHHNTTGEKGGLWKNRGRAPQKILTTGFDAEGFDLSSYYRRMPDSMHAEMSWMFEGIGENEIIGNFGLVGSGAAGQEIDRCDMLMGTPPGTYLVATSEGHSDAYLLVVEDIMFMYKGLGGSEHRDVRADLTYYENQAGGAVFAVSSIAWSGSLSHDGYRNNVSRITKNVIDHRVTP